MLYPYLKLLSPALLGLALLTSGCTTTQSSSSGIACRTQRAPASAVPYSMCAAQNFQDLGGTRSFGQAMPVKSLLRTDGTQAGAFLRYLWKKPVLSVAFLDDRLNLSDRVVEMANQWNTRAHANIRFVKTNDVAGSDIRVTFNGTGYWSVIGTQAQSQGSHATLCLAFSGQPSSTEFRRVVLHEFGHAIGLIHEQAQPLANIHWDKEKTYAYYCKPPNCWTHAMVDSNVFRHESENPNLKHTDFDRDSIMQYPVDASLTTDHRGIGWNTDVSPIDIQFIQTCYPSKSPTALRSMPQSSPRTVVARGSEPSARVATTR